MTDELKCVCAINHCKYYRGNLKPNPILYCKAFPEGIPDNIAVGEIAHDQIIDGQCGDLVYSKGINPQIAKPYPPKNMINHKLHGTDALCTIFHDIYLESSDEQIRLLARIGMRMSKNTHLALEDYKNMLVELGVLEVASDSRPDWQLRPKSLYRKQVKETKEI